ncbi:hypothetical protein [Natronorubrum sp. A-ect3]|uniref:DUF7344 domain-containing protein n=1 Tax=Natronorubrum sp. A-ect3 TaxID=3242698 RepID=UPI00359D861D
MGDRSSSPGGKQKAAGGVQTIEKSTSDAKLSRDTVFKTLSNRRRRLTLRYLFEYDVNGEPVRLRDLAEWIAAAENDVPVDAVTYKQRKRVYTSLYQSHLPALHRDGIIQYDQARGTISVTPVTSTFDTYLGVDPQMGAAWSTYWLALGVCLTLIAVLSWFDLFSLPISSHLLTLLVSLVVFVSAVVFAYHNDRGQE